MTETTDTGAQADADDQTDPTALDDTTDATGADSGDNTGDDGDTDGIADAASPNAEAAKWRTRLREVEAERDHLAEQLAGYRRRECEAAVADVLDQAGDLWDIGQVEPADFFGDDGTLNDAELRAAADALVEQRPRLAKQPELARSFNWGQVSAGHAPPGAGPSWSDIINPR